MKCHESKLPTTYMNSQIYFSIIYFKHTYTHIHIYTYIHIYS